MLFEVGASCRVLYSIVSCLCVRCSASGKREQICLLSLTCNYVVSVRRGFLFLLVLGMGCVILLWHSLGLPYYYFRCSTYIYNLKSVQLNRVIKHIYLGLVSGKARVQT